MRTLREGKLLSVSIDAYAASVALASVSKSYRDVPALRDVTLGFGDGVTVLVGRNGAGKSTLIRLLVGVEAPDSGAILRSGARVESADQWRSYHADVGWLPQSFVAPARMSSEDLLRYVGWLKGLSRKEVQIGLSSALAAVGLDDAQKRRLGDLSGGMYRRVGIAQALINDPKVLVLDEPTAGLDPVQRESFHHLIRDLAKGRTVIVSTHLVEDVEALASRIAVLDQGSVRFMGDPNELIELGDGGSGVEGLRSGFVRLVSPES